MIEAECFDQKRSCSRRCFSQRVALIGDITAPCAEFQAAVIDSRLLFWDCGWTLVWANTWSAVACDLAARRGRPTAGQGAILAPSPKANVEGLTPAPVIDGRLVVLQRVMRLLGVPH